MEKWTTRQELGIALEAVRDQADRLVREADGAAHNAQTAYDRGYNLGYKAGQDEAHRGTLLYGVPVQEAIERMGRVVELEEDLLVKTQALDTRNREVNDLRARLEKETNDRVEAFNRGYGAARVSLDLVGREELARKEEEHKGVIATYRRSLEIANACADEYQRQARDRGAEVEKLMSEVKALKNDLNDAGAVERLLRTNVDNLRAEVKRLMGTASDVPKSAVRALRAYVKHTTCCAAAGAFADCDCGLERAVKEVGL